MLTISMAKLNFSILCEYSIISNAGIPSFISVFSEITGKKLPFRKQEINLVTNFAIEESEKDRAKDLEITLKSPSGKVMASTKSKLIMEKEKKINEQGFISKFLNVEFKESGTHKFEVFLDGKMVGTVSLLISTREYHTSGYLCSALYRIKNL